VEKFNREPLFCLTSPDDAKALGEESNGLKVFGRGYIAPHTFYIGEDAYE
jgi:hypothetical protein